VRLVEALGGVSRARHLVPSFRVSFTFPGGDYEIRYLADIPKLGEPFTARGGHWIVETVDNDEGDARVTLRARRPTDSEPRID
jgi:hypothetical protein